MKDFEGFRFGNYHSEDLHLLVVSSSDRFIKDVLPSPTDYTLDVPGGDGKYYFGQTYGTREFTVNVAFEDIDEETWRKISQIFSTDKLQDLVFDENPYKTYRAKCKSAPNFKYICFRDKLTGDRVYKGEGSISFVCFYPLAYCFNKYVVSAADYYKYNTPQSIIEDLSSEHSKFNPQIKEQKITGIQKDRYNINKNMGMPWKGGYPTIEQVQYGELFVGGPGHSAEECALPDSSSPSSEKAKLILDIKGYWDNVPKWEKAAKLLTTPTLDYDQELIYLPQYNTNEYYNMDIGVNNLNSLIGSRLLVYNPGDIPVDFVLKLGNLSSNFRGNLEKYCFRISRYNVQRLTIQQAVDWTGLRTQDRDQEADFKYGTKYFSLTEKGSGNNFVQRELKLAHPNHCYITEPIPQEKLGYFIRLFYWQSNLLLNDMTYYLARPNHSAWDDTHGEFYPDGIKQDIHRHIFDHREGELIASRYEELRAQCTTDDERNELYWKTLREGILDRYQELNSEIRKTLNERSIRGTLNDTDTVFTPGQGEPSITKDSGRLYYDTTRTKYYIYDEDEQKYISATAAHRIVKPWFKNDEEYEEFVHDFIYHPSEFIKYNDNTNTDEKPEYGEFDFNITRLPQYFTFDYFDINNNGFDKIPYADCGCDLPKENHHREQILPLYLDSEKHLLYANQEPKYEFNANWINHNKDKIKNFYNYKNSKIVLNDNIEHGHWFKLPTGWSMIEVAPVVNETDWGNKRWLDARPFDWGTTDISFRNEYNQIYKQAAIDYLSQNYPKAIDNVGDSAAARKNYFSNQSLDKLEEYLQFRRWYDDHNYVSISDIAGKDYRYKHDSGSPDYISNKTIDNDKEQQVVLLERFGYELMQHKQEKAEIGFLKTIANYWRTDHKSKTGQMINWTSYDVEDWWWYANDYIWANFPPLYWGYADLLNRAEIKYIPQYY